MNPPAPPPSGPPLHWDAEGLWLALRPLLPELSVEVLASCPSTNSALLERARLSSSVAGGEDAAGPAPSSDAPRRRRDDQLPATPHGRRADDRQPCLLVAEHQTHGRGRLGRQWQASPGASLTFSLALPLRPADWSGLSLAVGVALADALDPLPAGTPPRIALKWPNDLWLRDAPGAGRKLGGVLIETTAIDGGARMAVVGVGLNVLPQALGELGSGYACLQELAADVSAPAALHRIALPLVRALLDFERDGFAPLVPAFATRDLLAGQAITTTLPGLPVGIADGVAADGALRVRVDNELHWLTSGEVSVRLQAADPAP